MRNGVPEPVDTLRGLIGDMACGIAVGGNDDENLRHYHDRLVRLAVELDDYLERWGPCTCEPLPTGEAPSEPDRRCRQHGEPPTPARRPDRDVPLINGEPAY